MTIAIRHPYRTLGAAALGILALIRIVSAQAPRTPATMDDLIAEVRGLRAELGQVAGASMRMQLFVARLTLQEQRITALARQLTDVQRELVGVGETTRSLAFGLKQTNEAPGDVPPEMRKEIEAHVARLKASFTQQQQREAQLRAQEVELSGMIAAEQARWQEFNARLDDLERALPSAVPR